MTGMYITDIILSVMYMFTEIEKVSQGKSHTFIAGLIFRDNQLQTLTLKTTGNIKVTS